MDSVKHSVEIDIRDLEIWPRWLVNAEITGFGEAIFLCYARVGYDCVYAAMWRELDSLLEESDLGIPVWTRSVWGMS